MDPSDVAALFYGDEASGPEKAQQLAAALRGDTQLGQLGLLTGDKVLGGVGQSLLQGAQAGQQQLEKAANMRLTKAMEAEKQKTEQQFRQSQEAHMTAQEAISRAQLAQGRFALSAPTPTSPGYVVDNKTGNARPLLAEAPGKPAGPGSGMKQAKDMDDALKALKDDIDPSRGRNGAFGQDLALTTAAKKVMGLVKNPETGEENFNLTVRQIPELVQAVGGMVSNGGHAAQSQLEHLSPQTAAMSLAQKMEWLTGHPEAAGAPEFVKQYYETAKREQGLAEKRIRDVQLDRLSAHQGHYKLYPEEFKANARQYLRDLSPEDLDAAFLGKYDRTAKPAAGAPAAGGLSPEKLKRLQELRALAAAGQLK